MQGTAITMRPGGSYKTEPAVVKTQRAEPVKETVAAKGETKKRSPWMWIGIGVTSILCLAVAFFAVIKNITRPQLGSTAEPTKITSIEIPPTSELPPTLPGGRTPGGPLPTPQLNNSPELAAAQELVNKNPGDPFAHLKLALALWDAKEFRPAMEELAQSANLAGPNNKEFLLQAAQEFKSREAWVAAAGMYLRLVPIYRNEGMPVELENDFHEAIYKATEQKDMPLFVFFERIDNASLPLGYIARGRYALYNGDMKDAKMQLSNAEKLKPEMYEVFLLKAEIEMKSGSQTEAKNILLSLSSDLGAPEWIRFMAENYLKALP